MILRHQRDEPLLDAHQRPEVRQIGRAEDEDEIDLVGGEFGHRALVIEHPHVELDQRKSCAEARDLGRQKIERQRLAAGDADRAAPKSLQVLDLRLHQVHVGQLLADVAHEQFARRRERDAARPALEQLCAELFLQIHDAAVDGGCRHIEVFGRLADRAGARDLVGILQKT